MLKNLIGIRLRRLLSSLFTAKSGIAAVAIYILLGVVFAGYSFMIGFGLGYMLIPMELDWIYFSLFVLIAAAVVFMFSIMETKIALFECMDNELLMSMPIRPSDILISRCAAVLIMNLVEAALLLIPAIVAYLVVGGSPLYAVGFLLVALLAILLVTVISALFGYIIALIASRFKHKNLVSVISSVAFLVLFFMAYIPLMQSSFNSSEDTSQMLDGMISSFAFFRPIGEACMFSPLPLIIIALISVGTTVLGATVMSRFYFRIITASKSNYSSSGGEARISTGTAFSALARKEIGRLFASSGYLLNGCAGSIFQVVLGIMFFINREQILPVLSELSAVMGIDSGYFSALLGIAVCSALPLSNAFSASTVSLEGKNFWILQSLPVDPLTVLYAKLVPHIMVTAPFTLALSVALGITLSIPGVCWPFMIVVPVISMLVGAILGLVLNVKFPKFTYTNEQEVVKQSLPVFIMTMLGMLCVLLCTGVCVFVAMQLGPMLSIVAIFILFVLLLVLLFWLLVTVTRRGFEKLLTGR